ncbi:MAG: carboxypeptidase regulatory-like domain-containing protein [Deltaproteobacteria bacterium]|nr:carboxypeptidase regulatory-like domain-containing protein [Deltaproteobacteria bacterium]
MFAILTMVPAAEAGTIVGRATYRGTPPQPRRIHMTADPECDRLNPDGVSGQTVVVAPDGSLAGVVLSIKEGLDADLKYLVPATAAVLDQHRCMFSPHVLGIRVGQVLEIKNSDATMHSVHAAPASGNAFNVAMPMLDQVIKKKFDSREVAVRVKCDVHPWMSAYVAVVEHPFFAVSGSDGSYAIENVPPGTYTLEAWHEALGVQTSTSVKVGGDQPTELDFSFGGK